MVIQHNISALNAHRNLGINNSQTSKNLEKLSSGYRINRAADDAAGLAISEKMRGQIRGLAMAEQNTSHGINLIQTAEGGLNETHAILQRMRELAVQSSNGTYQDVDRDQLTLEYEALKSEINRIAESTHYNNIKLLNGNLADNIYFQRIRDVNDILLNTTFDQMTTAGSEYLIEIAKGAVIDATGDATKVYTQPTAASITYNLQDWFDTNDLITAALAGEMIDIEIGGVGVIAGGGPVNLSDYLVRDANGDVLPDANGDFSVDQFDFAALAKDIADAINKYTGSELDYTASVDKDGNLVLTAKEDGPGTLDPTDIFDDATGAKEIQILLLESDGTTPSTAVTLEMTAGAVVETSFVDGDMNGWSRGSVELDFSGLTGFNLAASNDITMVIGDYEFTFTNDATAITTAAQLVAKMYDAMENDTNFLDYLDSLGLELGGYDDSTGNGSITIQAKELGDEANDALTNFALGDFINQATTASPPVPGAAYSTATVTVTPTTGTEGDFTEIPGSATKAIDLSKISVNGVAANATGSGITAEYNQKTDTIVITDADGNVHTIDASRLEKTGVDNYEVVVRAVKGDNLVFQIGANGGSDQRVYLDVKDMSAFSLGLFEGDIKSNGVEATAEEAMLLAFSNITTVADANAAIDVITAATNQVSAQRASLGALQNRLESTMNSLGITKENLTAAESTIRDVDMAAEMMEFTKNNILVQAAQAMLAQANQLPQGVLQLLR